MSNKVFEDSLNLALDECVARENEYVGNSEQLKMPVVGRRYGNISTKSAWVCKNIIIERTPNGKRCAILELENGDLGQEFDLKRNFWEVFEELPNQDNEEKQNPHSFGSGLWNGFEHHKIKKEAQKIHDKYKVKCVNAPVEKALEELREEVKRCEETGKHLEKKEENIGIGASRIELHNTIRQYHIMDLINKAQNLINALDESNIPEKGDCGIMDEIVKKIRKGYCDETGLSEDVLFGNIKDKSIWKPVSKLPSWLSNIFVKYKDGSIKLHQYCWASRGAVGGYGFLTEDAIEYCTLTDYITHTQQKQEGLERKTEGLEKDIKFLRGFIKKV